MRSICAFAHGVSAVDNTPTRMMSGSENCSTGRIHDKRLRPPVLNQTIISLSCQLRIITIRTAMKIETVRSGGILTRLEYATSSKTVVEPTSPPTASDKICTRPTVSTMEKSTVKTPPVLLASSLTKVRRKIIKLRRKSNRLGRL